jgi:hypothetical protein
MRIPHSLSLRLTLGLSLIVPASAYSQGLPQQPVQVEGRVDAIVARTTGVEAGVGLSVPSGIYMRTGLVAGIGAGRHGVEGRTDLISRFSLDPFRQSRWAPYGGAGVSGRYRSKLDGGSHAYLMIFLGVEGPLSPGATSGVVPAFELGLGGGARFAVILRRGINARR